MLSVICREDPVSGCSTDSLLARLHVNRFDGMKAGSVSCPRQTECPGFFTPLSLMEALLVKQRAPCSFTAGAG